uniref:Uncharacterized protein n=1 Tax=Rheinheimera sp. BAL341 TaxID=1708203 RepID=A0A486XQF8_9GAMM
MIVDLLIKELRELGEVSKPLFAVIEGFSEDRLFVYIFGNSMGLPTISVVVDEPLPENKNSQVLLKGLLIWKAEDRNPDAEVYLKAIHEYPDESYDFRYFKLQAIRDEGDHLILIGDKAEALELRQHYDAFDESMYADEEE